jgi:hypothetical protein
MVPRQIVAWREAGCHLRVAMPDRLGWRDRHVRPEGTEGFMVSDGGQGVLASLRSCEDFASLTTMPQRSG